MANHKKYYTYRGEQYTIDELSEISGYSVKQLRKRMYQGYSVEQAMREYPMHDSVIAFDGASQWEDWVGLPTSEFYGIYWQWCIRNEWQPVSQRQLSNQLLPKYNLRTVSMATNDGRSVRYIREQTYRDLHSGRVI